MILIFRINEDAEKMEPSDEITFNSLHFVGDQLGNLYLQDPEPPVQEEEQPPAIYMFLAGLEDAMEERPLALAHHMNLYAPEAINKFSQEYLLATAFEVWKDPCWVPESGPPPLPYLTTSYPVSQPVSGT